MAGIELPRLNPLPAFSFYVALVEDAAVDTRLMLGVLGQFIVGGFAECSGLESTLEVEEYKEGGVNDKVHRFPTRAVYGNITLTRGVSFSEQLWLWHESFVNGRGVRRNGLIVLANEARLPLKIWSFVGGLPVRYGGPALDATSSSVATESLEIAHEKLELLMSPGKLADAVAGALF